MLEKEFAFLVSFLIFIPALIVFVIRKKSLEEIINYILVRVSKVLIKKHILSTQKKYSLNLL